MSRNPIWDYFSKSETDASKAKCIECSKCCCVIGVNRQPTRGLQAFRATIMISRPPPSTGSGLWDDYDNYTAAVSQPNLEVASEETELCNYLREPRIARSANIYSYWNCSQFPGLEPAARKYLSAPPISVASEQLFSAAGQIYADRRSNLLGENAEKLLFMAYNIRLFNYCY